MRRHTKPELSRRQVYFISISLAIALNAAFLYALNCKLMAASTASRPIAIVSTGSARS